MNHISKYTLLVVKDLVGYDNLVTITKLKRN